MVGTLRGRRREARVRMRGFCAGLFRDFRRPSLALPVDALGGGSSVMPSHHTPPSGVSATFVKIVFFASVAIAFGFVFADVPGATPKKPASGLIARSRPVRVGLDPGNVVADGPDLPALETLRRNHHREIGLAAGARETPPPHTFSRPADLPRPRSACAPPSSLRRARCSRRCAARNISCRAARFRRSRNHRTRSRASPGNGRCISLCCRATARLFARARAARRRCACTAQRASSSLSISLKTGRPMRAMMRMFTTT